MLPVVIQAVGPGIDQHLIAVGTGPCIVWCHGIADKGVRRSLLHQGIHIRLREDLYLVFRERSQENAVDRNVHIAVCNDDPPAVRSIQLHRIGLQPSVRTVIPFHRSLNMVLDYIDKGRHKCNLPSGWILCGTYRYSHDLQHLVKAQIGAFAAFHEREHQKPRLDLLPELSRHCH